MSCLTFNYILNVYATTEFREKITLSCVISLLGHRSSSRNLGLITLLISARKGKPPLLRRFKLPYRRQYCTNHHFIDEQTASNFKVNWSTSARIIFHAIRVVPQAK